MARFLIDALSRLDPDERDAVHILDAIDRSQETTIISEPGAQQKIAKIFTDLIPKIGDLDWSAADRHAFAQDIVAATREALDINLCAGGHADEVSAVAGYLADLQGDCLHCLWLDADEDDAELVSDFDEHNTMSQAYQGSAL